MANKNLNKLQMLASKYDVVFQPLYTDKAITNGSLDIVHKAVINGKEYTCLQQYNNEQLENLFKTIACGNASIHAQENKVMFTKNDTVSINGNRYSLFEIVKDIEFNRLNSILSEYLNNGEEWQVELAEKIRAYMNNGGFIEWLEYQYQKEYNETVDEYLARECVEV